MNNPYANFLISELRTTDWNTPAKTLSDIPHISQILALGRKAVGIPMMQELIHSLFTTEQHRILIQSLVYGGSDITTSLICLPPTTPENIITGHLFLSRPPPFFFENRAKGILSMRNAVRREDRHPTSQYWTAWIWHDLFPNTPIHAKGLSRLNKYLSMWDIPPSFLHSPLEPIFRDIQKDGHGEEAMRLIIQRFEPFLSKKS